MKYNCHYILDSCTVIYQRIFMTFFLNKTDCPTDITQKSCVRRLGWVRMIGFMKRNCFRKGIYNWWVAGVRERTWHGAARNYLVVFCVWWGTGGIKNRNLFSLQNQIYLLKKSFKWQAVVLLMGVYFPPLQTKKTCFLLYDYDCGY